MSPAIDTLMYGVSQWFLTPVLAAIGALFAYAFFALGACLVQAVQRRRGHAAGFELRTLRLRRPGLPEETLELEALRRLELVRIATRVAPMLGLVATMIPMGPALKSLGDGQMADVSQHLAVAFSAVILALVTAAITCAIGQVRRRWYASELVADADGSPR